jgi:hypothetical protein
MLGTGSWQRLDGSHPPRSALLGWAYSKGDGVCSLLHLSPELPATPRATLDRWMMIRGSERWEPDHSEQSEEGHPSHNAAASVEVPHDQQHYVVQGDPCSQVPPKSRPATRANSLLSTASGSGSHYNAGLLTLKSPMRSRTMWLKESMLPGAIRTSSCSMGRIYFSAWQPSDSCAILSPLSLVHMTV